MKLRLRRSAMELNITSMFNASKIIRLMIVILGCILLWRMWGYLSPNVAPAMVQNDDSSAAVLDAPSQKEFFDVPVISKFQVDVYYEALCPDSRHFIMKQLTPAFEKLGSFISIGLVPYGKATTINKGTDITFNCQHGPLECKANKVHACVTNNVKDEKKQLQIVHCMISNNMHPMDVGKKCVEESGEEWPPIESCASTGEGDLILKRMGVMTNQLQPSVSFIPTITIDKSQDGQNSILQNLTKVICSRFKGEIPAVCS